MWELCVSLVVLLLVNYFVDCRFFVTWTGYNIFIICRNVTAQHRRCFLWLQFHNTWLKKCVNGRIKNNQFKFKMIFLITWNMLAPYGVRQAFNILSFPVDTNHLPQVANRSERTQLSCNSNWYLSGLLACNTSTCEFSIPTANQSPDNTNKFRINNWERTRELYISTNQLDSIQVRRSVKWSRVAVIVFPLANPMIAPYYLSHQSINDYRPG